MILIGASVITGSVIRVILTMVLYFSLDSRAEEEERRLENVYPEYKEYKTKVSNKFLPLFVPLFAQDIFTKSKVTEMRP